MNTNTYHQVHQGEGTRQPSSTLWDTIALITVGVSCLSLLGVYINTLPTSTVIDTLQILTLWASGVVAGASGLVLLWMQLCTPTRKGNGWVARLRHWMWSAL